MGRYKQIEARVESAMTIADDEDLHELGSALADLLDVLSALDEDEPDLFDAVTGALLGHGEVA